MKKLLLPILISLLILSCADLFAQKEAYNWIFGNRAGITFNPDGKNPVVLANVSPDFNQSEGIAAISDKDGKLLMYTDGINVWSRDHYLMPNGTALEGNSSSTQGALILPKPGSSDIYYIFTVPDMGKPTGLRYSIVDMSLNGGLGDIVQGKKSMFVYGPVTEKLTAVRHANGRDFWVLTHAAGTREFRAYLLTDQGLKDFVSSGEGESHDGINFNNIGYMKASIDGKTIALAICGKKVVELFDFDNSTGKLKRKLTINKTGQFKEIYGLEISPDGSKLYVGEFFSTDGNLYQFDLNAGSESEIAFSSRIIAAGSSFGALQLAPDGKIYVAVNDNPYLGVINEPNKPGNLCGYIRDGLNLGQGKCSLGLPNFLQSYILKVMINGNSTLCEGDTLELSSNVPLTGPGAEYSWFGPSGFLVNGQLLKIPGFNKSMEGYYRLEVRDNGNTITDSIYVDMYDRPVASITPSGTQYLCKGDSILLQAGTSGADYTYSWSDGSRSSSIYATKEGTYSVIVRNEFGCTDTSSVDIVYYPQQDLNIHVNGPVAFCQGDSTVLEAPVPGTGDDYTWSTGEKTRTITVRQSGVYTLSRKNNSSCIARDSIEIIVHPFAGAAISAAGPTEFCLGGSVELTAEPYLPGYKYLWSTGDTSNKITVSGKGNVSLYVVNEAGCTDTATVFINVKAPDVKLNYNGTAIICPGQNLEVTTISEFQRYKWSTGAETRSVTISTPGSYYVEVWDAEGCSNRAYLDVKFNDFSTCLPGNIEIEAYKTDNAYSLFMLHNCGSNDTVRISRIYAGRYPQHFSVTYPGVFPADITDSDTLAVKIAFNANMEEDIHDTLYIETTLPCNRIIPVPLTVKNAGLLVYVPNLEGKVGTEHFSIPVKAKFGKSLNGRYSYSAIMEFDATLMFPDASQNNIDSVKSNGKKWNVWISGSDVEFNDNEIILADVKGLLALPEEDKVPVRIIDFVLDNRHVFIDTIAGSVTANGICRPDYSRLQLLPYDVSISPNPAGESLEIKMEGEYKGRIVLNIYDSRGRQRESISMEKNDFTYKYRLNTETYPVGCYNVIINAENMFVGHMFVVYR